MLSWDVFPKVRNDLTALRSLNSMKNIITPSSPKWSFFPLFSDNFGLYTINNYFFGNVLHWRRKNGKLYKSNIQPNQQNWFWPVSKRKIRFVKLNWISDNRDFRICKHFLICPIHVSCHLWCSHLIPKGSVVAVCPPISSHLQGLSIDMKIT